MEAGWLTRHAEVRGPGLHHKSHTTLNQDKVRAILSGSQDVTELVSPDVTKLVSPDVTELVDAKSVTPPVTELVSSDVTELVNPLPKVSHISISLNNNNQSKINLPEEEAEMNPPRADHLHPGWIYCDRCHQLVKMDEPHLYPMSNTPCTAEAHDPEQAKIKEWDLAWGRHELEVKPSVERQDGFIYFLDEITSELDYKREVLRVVNHHERKDVRLCCGTGQTGTHYFRR